MEEKCNIDNREQRKRYFLGVSGFTVAGLSYAADYMGLVDFSGILFTAALFVGFSGIFQGYVSFCSGYGFLGKKVEDGDIDDVPADERIEDVLEAFKLQLLAALSTVLVILALGSF